MADKNATNKKILNLIGEGTVIDGEITSAGDIRVDGQISGNISSPGKLVVGVKGNIGGDISAQSVDISGSIKGNINTKSLYLKETANLLSDIVTEQIVIEPGAKFSGNIKMPNQK